MLSHQKNGKLLSHPRKGKLLSHPWRVRCYPTKRRVICYLTQRRVSCYLTHGLVSCYPQINHVPCIKLIHHLEDYVKYWVELKDCVLICCFVALGSSIYSRQEIDWVAEIYAMQSRTVECCTKSSGYAGSNSIFVVEKLRLSCTW